jgi:hypothetical protein
MSTIDSQTSRDGLSQTLVQATGGSPTKKRKTNITTAQKQALIDNLQLESMTSMKVSYVNPINTDFASLSHRASPQAASTIQSPSAEPENAY